MKRSNLSKIHYTTHRKKLIREVRDLWFTEKAARREERKEKFRKFSRSHVLHVPHV